MTDGKGSQGGGSLRFARGSRVKGCTMAMRLVIKPLARILVPISPAHLTLPASAAQHTHGFGVYMKRGPQSVQRCESFTCSMCATDMTS